MNENQLRVVQDGGLRTGRAAVELVTAVPILEGGQSDISLTFGETSHGSCDNCVDILLRKPAQGLVLLVKRDYLRSCQGT